MKIFSFALAFLRMFLFALLTFTVYFSLLFTNLFFKSQKKKLARGIRYRRSIIRGLHIILGTKVTVYGTEPSLSGLIILNHRSYFDPIVILKNILCYPVGKEEVASWPVIGPVCKTTGVIFVKRESKESRKETLNKINTVLENGYSILIAPEGTTHSEDTTIDFRPGSFVKAVTLNIPVHPIAVDYKNKADFWVGNDTFVPHFFRCFGKLRTEIKISYLPPIYGDNVDLLVADTKREIDTELLRFRKDWEN